MLTFLQVTDWKEIPLGVIEGVEVKIQEEVIFKVGYFLDFPKVAWFKPRVKEQRWLFHISDHEWNAIIFKLPLPIYFLHNAFLYSLLYNKHPIIK